MSLTATPGPSGSSPEWDTHQWRMGRTATVMASEPARVVAVPGSALRELMAETPEVNRAIRKTGQARLLNR